VFSDRVRLVARSGRGGDGGLSFRREKYVPKGGPDGGDGGRGGDVIVVADPRLRDLSPLRGRRAFAAGRGGSGRGGRRHGADGSSVEIVVPVGTQVTSEEDGGLLADLARPGARVVVARGGLGGRGNARFATPTRQAPRFAETGLPGSTVTLDLRLKLLADAALVGLPNAGKSSLLRRISNATPKVADYPFTTLQPVLGTVEAPDGAQLTVADVPGLIEGASQGVGLGHDFLAHLERARMLVHVIDGSEGDADERFRAIDRELELYGAGLDERPQIVVLNKADLTREPAPFGVEDGRILAVHRVSAATGAGIPEFRNALFALCPAAPEAVETEPELPEFLEYRPTPPERRSFRILRTDRGFRVVGEAPEGDALEEALRGAGVRKGALVEIGDEELEWQP
jgi:GTP-binding protein